MSARPPRFVPRAERFSLSSWILYRPAGDVRWREGRTKNISESGVLFHGPEPVPVDVPVELMMKVPSEILGPAEEPALGRGRIVRHGRERSDARPTLAAAITGWESLKDPRGI
jgi:hypothetical protein